MSLFPKVYAVAAAASLMAVAATLSALALLFAVGRTGDGAGEKAKVRKKEKERELPQKATYSNGILTHCAKVPIVLCSSPSHLTP